jgi:hypothetical protein
MTSPEPHSARQREAYLDAAMMIATTAGAVIDQQLANLVDSALAGPRKREVMLALAQLGASLLGDWAEAKDLSLVEAAAHVYNAAEDEAGGTDDGEDAANPGSPD